MDLITGSRGRVDRRILTIWMKKNPLSNWLCKKKSCRFWDIRNICNFRSCETMNIKSGMKLSIYLVGSKSSRQSLKNGRWCGPIAVCSLDLACVLSLVQTLVYTCVPPPHLHPPPHTAGCTVLYYISPQLSLVWLLMDSLFLRWSLQFKFCRENREIFKSLC